MIPAGILLGNLLHRQPRGEVGRGRGQAAGGHGDSPDLGPWLVTRAARGVGEDEQL